MPYEAFVVNYQNPFCHGTSDLLRIGQLLSHLYIRVKSFLIQNKAPACPGSRTRVTSSDRKESRLSLRPALPGPGLWIGFQGSPLWRCRGWKASQFFFFPFDRCVQTGPCRSAFPKGLINDLGNGLCGEGFHHEFSNPDSLCLLFGNKLTESRAENDRNIGPDLQDFSRQV